jgi:crossover junction endodeoxyribonuclease RuvC
MLIAAVRPAMAAIQTIKPDRAMHIMMNFRSGPKPPPVCPFFRALYYLSICYGVIQNKPKVRHSMCLVAIREALVEVIEKFQPDCCAIEAIIYVQSHATAIIMGAARGASLLAAAEAGLMITEYAPRRVKQAVVGRGGADL